MTPIAPKKPALLKTAKRINLPRSAKPTDLMKGTRIEAQSNVKPKKTRKNAGIRIDISPTLGTFEPFNGFLPDDLNNCSI